MTLWKNRISSQSQTGNKNCKNDSQAVFTVFISNVSSKSRCGCVYPQNRLYPQINSANIIIMAIHVASKNSMIAIPTAIQNIAKPQIFFIPHIVSVSYFNKECPYSSICGASGFSPQKKLLTAIPAPAAASFSELYYALSTFPDFKQEVQTYNFFVAPFTLHLTDLMFGLNILLDLLCEWLTLLPKRTPFPQTEHLAIGTPPCII